MVFPAFGLQFSFSWFDFDFIGWESWWFGLRLKVCWQFWQEEEVELRHYTVHQQYHRYQNTKSNHWTTKSTKPAAAFISVQTPTMLTGWLSPSNNRNQVKSQSDTLCFWLDAIMSFLTQIVICVYKVLIYAQRALLSRTISMFKNN